MDLPISDSDLLSRGFARAIRYSELKNMTLRELLQSLPMAILYEIKPGFGHWTCLFQRGDGVEFFDPLGYVVDDEMKVIGPRAGQDIPYLRGMLYLLAKEGVPISYNQFKLQADNTNSCGKWCSIRLLHAGSTAEEFAKIYNTPNGEKMVQRIYGPSTSGGRLGQR